MRKTHIQLQNANCKLQIANCRVRTSCPFCNLQFAICNFQSIVAALLFFALTALNTVSFGDEPAPPPQRAPREIYVPFSDLHVLLEQQPKRVLLGRAEYDDLVKKAKRAPETHAPQAVAALAADYAMTLERDNADIHGLLTIDVLEDGLHALPLDLGGMGLAESVAVADRAMYEGKRAGRDRVVSA